MGQIGKPIEEEIIVPIEVPDTVPPEWELDPLAPIPTLPEPKVPIPA